jgi:hypothetical protein
VTAVWYRPRPVLELPVFPELSVHPTHHLQSCGREPVLCGPRTPGTRPVQSFDAHLLTMVDVQLALHKLSSLDVKRLEQYCERRAVAELFHGAAELLLRRDAPGRKAR